MGPVIYTKQMIFLGGMIGDMRGKSNEKFEGMITADGVQFSTLRFYRMINLEAVQLPRLGDMKWRL